MIKDITYRQTYVPSRTLTLTKVAKQSLTQGLTNPPLFAWHQPRFHVFPKTKTFIFAGQCPASTLDGCPKMRSKGEMCRRFFLVVQPRRGASSHPSVNPGWYKCPRTTSHPLLMLSPHLDTASAKKNIMWQNCTNLVVDTPRIAPARLYFHTECKEKDYV